MMKNWDFRIQRRGLHTLRIMYVTTRASEGFEIVYPSHYLYRLPPTIHQFRPKNNSLFLRKKNLSMQPHR